jgi:septum formation protein
VEFRVIASGAAEGDDPVANARAKAEEVGARAGVPAGGAVLGADTEVVLDGRALGKPGDVDAAAGMLRALAGRSHVVRSAVCVLTQRDRREICGETRVTFRDLPQPLLAWYLGTGEWRDRAGGYAVQGAGAALLARIEGDPSTVIGLPLAALAVLLDDLGLAPWSGGGAPGRDILAADTAGEAP